MNPPTLFQKMRSNRHAAWLRMERQKQVAECMRHIAADVGALSQNLDGAEQGARLQMISSWFSR